MQPAPQAEAPATRDTARIKFELSIEYSPLLLISGTTTIARDEARSLFERHKQPDVGYLELPAVLQREPTNPVNPLAVAVFVEGERIGYLPSYAASTLDLTEHGSLEATVQLFSARRTDGVRVEGWVWTGDGQPQWKYGADIRPPMTTEEKRAAASRGADQMVAEAIAGGGARAPSLSA